MSEEELKVCQLLQLYISHIYMYTYTYTYIYMYTCVTMYTHTQTCAANIDRLL